MSESEIINYPEIGAKYKHYKGGIYKFITMATHSEKDEKLVIYKSLLFGSIYARPLSSWNETVQTKDGRRVQRFEIIR